MEEVKVNAKFNKLTVVRKDNKPCKWVCVCECGKEKSVTATNLRNGGTKSCGCIRGQKNRGQIRVNGVPKLYKGFNDLSATYWGIIKSGAKIRNLEFSITIEDAWNKFEEQEGRCALSGFTIFLDKQYGRHSKAITHNRNLQTASLDRIDSSKGYTKDNIQWIHKVVNPMKMDMNENDFLYWCAIIAKYKGRV